MCPCLGVLIESCQGRVQAMALGRFSTEGLLSYARAARLTPLSKLTSVVHNWGVNVSLENFFLLSAPLTAQCCGATINGLREGCFACAVLDSVQTQSSPGSFQNFRPGACFDLLCRSESHCNFQLFADGIFSHLQNKLRLSRGG